MAAPARTRARRRARRPAALERPVSTPPGFALAFAALELRLSGIAQQALTGNHVDTIRGRRQLQRQAQALITRLRADFRSRARAIIESAYGEGAKLAGARPPGAVKRAALDTLTRSAIVKLDGALNTVGRQYDDVFRRVGLEQAARQVGRELPREAAADLMRQELRRRGLTGFVDRRGRRWTLSNYSRMVIATTTAEASNRGVADAIIAVGRDLVRISLPEGHPGCKHHPADPLNPCRALEGKVLSLTGRTPGYPRLVRIPPFHPFCAHGLAPAPEPPT